MKFSIRKYAEELTEKYVKIMNEMFRLGMTENVMDAFCMMRAEVLAAKDDATISRKIVKAMEKKFGETLLEMGELVLANLESEAEKHDEAMAEKHDEAMAEKHDEAMAEKHDEAMAEKHDEAMAEKS